MVVQDNRFGALKGIRERSMVLGPISSPISVFDVSVYKFSFGILFKFLATWCRREPGTSRL
jgi:hypothetical protein